MAKYLKGHNFENCECIVLKVEGKPVQIRKPVEK